MTYQEIVNTVASNLNLPSTFVNKVYRAYWRVVREHISSQPLKEDFSDEEFLILRPNVNIPSLGKFYVTVDRYRKMKRSYHRYLEQKALFDKEKTENKNN